MKETKSDASRGIEQLLHAYRIEPVGRFLSGRLRLSLPLIWFLFAFLYFGVLLLLHNTAGTPKPTNPGDLFRNPSTIFYYPNLIAITYDLIGNPLFFVMLVAFQNYIPSQFTLLEQSEFIKRKPATSRAARIVGSLGTNSRFQIATMIFFPILVAVGGLVVDILVFSPQGTPAQYAVFLSLLGRYARAVVLVQLGYIFITLSNYGFSFRLHLNHPDECSGLAPFGRLALAGYFYLFVFAMMQAISSAAGGSSFERALNTLAGAGAFGYLWILFPLASMFVFSQFIYGPHRALENLKTQYLLTASSAWTKYHDQLLSSILKRIEQPKVSLTDKAGLSINDELEQLEAWTKLNKNIEDMHTWPIPKRAFRVIVVLANPLVPIFLPLVIDAMRDLLP